MRGVTVPLAAPGAISLPPALEGALFLPLDLDAAEHCRVLGLDFRLPPMFSDSAAYNALWRQVADLADAAMYDARLFPSVPAPVNPLFIVVHALIALLGNAVIRANELDALIATAAGRHGCLLQTRLPVSMPLPFIDPLTAARIGFADRIDIAEPLALPVASLLADGEGESLRRRLIAGLRDLQGAFDRWRHPAAVAVDVVANSPRFWAALRQANERAGHPLRLRLIYGAHCHDAGRFDPGLARGLDLAAEGLIAAAGRLATSPERASAIAWAMYRHWREDLVRAVSAGTTAIRDTVAVSVETICGTVPTRVNQYRKYLAGVKLVFQEFSDSECISVSDVKTSNYLSVPVSSASLYRGPYGFVQAEHVARHTGRRLPATTVAPAPFGAGRPVRPGGPWKIVYVPAAFSGHFRHGPCRETHDIVMWDAQMHIMDVLCAVPGARVVYKAHPKDGPGTGNRAIQAWQVEQIRARGAAFTKGALEAELADADLVVCDYFGSGFVRCLQSGVPAVYLQFGVVDFYPEVADDFCRACAIVAADFRHAAWKPALAAAVTGVLSGDLPLRPEPFQRGLFGAEDAGDCYAEVVATILDLGGRGNV